jgi:hypothetical protein
VAEPAAAVAGAAEPGSLLGGEQQLMEFLFTSLDAGCEGLMLKLLDGPGGDCCRCCCAHLAEQQDFCRHALLALKWLCHCFALLCVLQRLAMLLLSVVCRG